MSVAPVSSSVPSFDSYINETEKECLAKGDSLPFDMKNTYRRGVIHLVRDMQFQVTHLQKLGKSVSEIEGYVKQRCAQVHTIAADIFKHHKECLKERERVRTYLGAESELLSDCVVKFDLSDGVKREDAKRFLSLPFTATDDGRGPVPCDRTIKIAVRETFESGRASGLLNADQLKRFHVGLEKLGDGVRDIARDMLSEGATPHAVCGVVSRTSFPYVTLTGSFMVRNADEALTGNASAFAAKHGLPDVSDVRTDRVTLPPPPTVIDKAWDKVVATTQQIAARIVR